MNTRHVPDLEHCQELDRLCKEKGIVVPETDMYWQTYPEGETRLVTGINSFANPKNIHVPAPLVSEQGVFMKDKGMGVTAHSAHSGWWATGGEWIVSNQKYLKTIEDKDSWPNCLQKMLNYLIETGSITEL